MNMFLNRKNIYLICIKIIFTFKIHTKYMLIICICLILIQKETKKRKRTIKNKSYDKIRIIRNKYQRIDHF